MAKPIEVLLPDGGTPFHVTVDGAWELVRKEDAKWTGRKQVQLTPYVNNRETNSFLDAWALIPSGGMPVWQMLT